MRTILFFLISFTIVRILSDFIFTDENKGTEFNVGDCISLFHEGNEFQPPHNSAIIYKIIKKGEKGYLTTSRNKYVNDEYIIFDWAEFYTKVDCPK